MRVVTTGMIATYPVGGVAWDYGQYALGLERMGHEVYYLEDAGTQTYDPSAGSYGDDPSYAVAWLDRTLRELSPTLVERWHFRSALGECFGIDTSRFAEIVAGADLFLNVSGSAKLRDAYMRCPCKVLIDTDPGLNHFVNYPKWDRDPRYHESHGYRAHDWFFTYAMQIGRPGCVLPDMGLAWHATVPLVEMDRWRNEPPNADWTTVMTWNNYGKPFTHDGVTYGTKEREFVHIESAPARTAARLEIAVGGIEPPLDHFRELGWSVVQAADVSRTIDDYRAYIQRSRGEFSVAKNYYVATCSGWFSCRTVCYLAAGLPAVVQETGFGDFLPTGEGLHAFADLDEAIAALEDVESDYDRHRRRAREIARDYFDSPVVLGDMFRTMGIS